MFMMGFRNRQTSGGSPRVAIGSPRGTASGSPRSGNDSPRVEVGEIDTRAPFQSVKAAVSLFGEVAFSKEKPVIRRSKQTSSENVLDKETQLLFAQNELNKLKEQLKSVDTTKSRALSDLERSKRAMLELTKKLQSAIESKKSAVEVTEAVKDRVMQLEAANSRSPRGDDGTEKKELDLAKEQYVATFAELDAAKQQLTKVRQDFDSALESKMLSFEQAADAQYAAKVNTERLRELSKEIEGMKESRSQVKHTSEQGQQEHAKFLAEKNARQQSHKAAMEEAQNKLISLKKESDPEVTRNLEEKLAETTADIEALQDEMKHAHACDMESIRIITSELNDATRTLQEVAEEEFLLQNLVDSIKVELKNVKEEHTELTHKEAGIESGAEDLQIKLQESKAELEAAFLEEIRTKEVFDDMNLKLQQLSFETENSEKEADEMKIEAKRLKQEAETARIEVEEAEKKMPVALREAKDAETAENIALDEIRVLSDRTDAERASQPGNGSQIKLSTEEFESLSRKAVESENLVEMKVAAAMAQLEAINASKNEADKMLEANLEEITNMKAETEAALKAADMAEAAKQAVEGELRRWRQQEKNKGIEVSEISPETSPRQF